MENGKRIGFGRTAEVLEYGEDKIVKLFHERMGEGAVHYEFAVNEWVHKLVPAAPKPYELVRMDGRLGIIYQRKNGTTLLKLLLSRLWRLNRLSRLLAEIHYGIHELTPGHEPAPVPAMKDMLAANIRRTELLSEDEKERIMAYMEALPDERRLCHGDYHPDNVMIGSTPSVIDWTNATLGSPAGDAARTVVLLSTGTLPDNTPAIVNTLIGMIRRRLKNVYLRHYLKLSGLKASDVEKWTLPVAAARLVEWGTPEEQEQLLQIIRSSPVIPPREPSAP